MSLMPPNFDVTANENARYKRNELKLNIKVVDDDIRTSVYDERDDFGFPIVNFLWLSGDVPRLPSYGIYIPQLICFARCCTSVLNFSKLLSQGNR